MTFDEIVAELAAVLERSPEMPFAQYMVPVPGQGGLYHLTLTAPGRPTPVETVDALEKEREHLRGQVAAMEPMGTQVAALQATVKLLQDQIQQQTVTLQTTIRSVQDQAQQQAVVLQEAVRSLQDQMQQQITGLGDETRSFKALGDRFGGEIERMHAFMVELQGFAQEVLESGRAASALAKEQFTNALLAHEKKLSGWAAEARGELERWAEEQADALSAHEQVAQDQAAGIRSELQRRAQEQAAAFKMYEQIVQDWVIEARNELQQHSRDLVTDTQANLTAARDTFEQVEQALSHGIEVLLRQEAETTEVARSLATTALERLLALQQDIMRHVTGASAASREAADATLAAVTNARTDVLRYLTNDVAEATKALQRGADLLPTHIDLMTKIELLKDEYERVKGVLDAAERLVHSVLPVSPDLLSPELRELRAQWEAA